MNQSIYSIDWKVFGRWMVPFRLRTREMMCWVEAQLAVVGLLHTDFKKWKKVKDYELMITSQVCYLELMLNDKYDPTLRRIYIDDAVNAEPLYLYQDAELKPVYLNQDGEAPVIFLYDDAEIAGFDVIDFIVFIARPHIRYMDEMAALLNKFKLYGMRFKFQMI